MGNILRVEVHEDISLELYSYDAGPPGVYVLITDFLNGEAAEIGLNKEQALQVGLALVNWAGENK